MPTSLLPAGLTSEEVVACVGLISDTHLPQRCAALPENIFALFADVDLILHAGDVGELRVLDDLSRYAPVVAVHGNDETRIAQRELPYQQVVTVAGQRILLWHSHYPDRVDELASRRSDEIREKLWRAVERGKRAGAQVVVFGHWHIPLLLEADGVLVVNPGAIASGGFLVRQVRQTVALLFLRKEGAPCVVHVDLADPARIYHPPTDLDGGFQTAAAHYSASILAPDLAAHEESLRQQLDTFGLEHALPPFLRVAHRCWAGEIDQITRAALLQEVRNDPDLSQQRKNAYMAILENLSGAE